MADPRDRERIDALTAALGGPAALLEALPEGAALLGARGEVLAANRPLAALLDRAPASLVGHSLAALLAPDQPALAALVAADAERGWLELQHLPRTGQPLELRISASPLRDEAGGRRGTLVLVSDLTEQRRGQAERAALERQLAEAQKMEAIGRVAGGVAHDFNNLLSVIMTGASVLRSELPPTHRGQLDVDEIDRAAQRSAELTRHLLAFSRRQMIQLRPLDLNAAIAGMEPMLRRLVREDVALVFELAPHLPPIHADPSLIERVLLNLVVNARDAMPDGGTIVIQTRSLRSLEAGSLAAGGDPLVSQVLLRVRDTGSGMDEATRARIFEPFFTTKGPGGGTGLGLATVYGIVRQCGGTIEVHSEPARGSRFDLRFPPSTDVVRKGRTTTAPPPDPQRRGRVLLVEDEPTVRRAARRVLERDGYQVVVAASAHEALTLHAGDEPIDLVLTDVVMPGMNGRELAERLRERQPGLPIVYMSGHAEDEILLRGLRTEAIDFIAKPFTAESLLGVIGRVMARLAAPQAARRETIQQQ